jgi:hypothetical protein
MGGRFAAIVEATAITITIWTRSWKKDVDPVYLPNSAEAAAVEEAVQAP